MNSPNGWKWQSAIRKNIIFYSTHSTPMMFQICSSCSMVFHDFPTPPTKHGCLEELLSDVSKRNPGRCQHWVVEASANQWIHSICGIWCWEVMRYYMMERDRERERERGKKRERKREREINHGMFDMPLPAMYGWEWGHNCDILNGAYVPPRSNQI